MLNQLLVNVSFWVFLGYNYQCFVPFCGCINLGSIN